MSKLKRSKHDSEELSSSSCSSSSLSSDEEVDALDLKPIKDYLSNRRELARQLFKSVKAEKIRMMLPQALKRVNLEELEEWCASELSGMSKTRILCILNGKSMEESSATSESDDSGPSLEIISDTEEWFTDEDVGKKEDALSSGNVKSRKGRMKVKSKSQIQKKVDMDKSTTKSKVNNNEKTDDKSKDIKIKTENENNRSKEKDGDSLLDLLELEMRARAIRALIRKEEDIIPNTDGSGSTKSNQSSNKVSANKDIQDNLAKENCRRQIEKIISAQHAANEDEDVVLVVQPTPTIELLSSDSEMEGHSSSRVNQRLENERIAVDAKNSDGKTTSSHKTITVSNKETENSIDKQNKSNENLTDNQQQSNHREEKKRKPNKRSRTKDRSEPSQLEESTALKSSKADMQDTICTNLSENSKISENMEHANKHNEENVVKAIIKETENQPVVDRQLETQAPKKKITAEDEKLVDMDEIIDLDDYSDDMEDIENYGSNKNKNKQSEAKEEKVQKEVTQGQKPNSAETWASRYYQTDDVQSVIKESKIQSEIRKRLRERQRLSKLNKSPNTSSSTSNSLTDSTYDASVQKPTGSVDEYLALKRNGSINTNSESDNSNSNMIEDKNQPSDSRLEVDSTITNSNVTDVNTENKNVEQNSTITHVNVLSNTVSIELNSKTNPT